MADSESIRVSGIPAPLYSALLRIAEREGKSMSRIGVDALEAFALDRGEWPPSIGSRPRIETDLIVDSLRHMARLRGDGHISTHGCCGSPPAAGHTSNCPVVTIAQLAGVSMREVHGG